MSKFNISLYGYHKRSVHEMLKRLESEHARKRQALEHELQALLTGIEKGNKGDTFQRFSKR